MSLAPLAHLVSFDGIVLHDGTNKFASKVLNQQVKSQLNIIPMPDGSLYDNDGNGQAITYPAKFTSPHTFKFGTYAALQAAVDAVTDKGGWSGTAVGEDISGNSISCTARLETVAIKYEDGSFVAEIKLTLQPMGAWS